MLSDEAARAGLGVTLFERLHARHGAAASEMLTVQYRMNAAIMQWASDELYGGLLEAHESVAGHTVADLPRRDGGGGASGGGKSGGGSGKGGGGKGAKGAKSSGAKGGGAAGSAAAGGGGGGGGGSVADVPVLLLIDTAGCGFEEQQEEEGDSM